MTHMEYGGDSDYKRRDQLRNPRDYSRRSALEEPADLSGDERRIKWRHEAKCFFALLIRPSIVLPTAFVAAGALVVTALATGSVRQTAVGVVIGSVTTGIFGWTRAIDEELSTRRRLRRQLSITSDLGFSDFSEEIVADAYLRGRRMSGAKFSRSEFRSADFSRAELIDARFSGGQFYNSNFEGADLTGAGLFKAQLECCDFRDSVLYRATLVHANLQHANLSGADLRGADLRGADLTGATVDLETKFDQTWYSPETKWPDDYEYRLVTGLLRVTMHSFDSHEGSAIRGPKEIELDSDLSNHWANEWQSLTE